MSQRKGRTYRTRDEMRRHNNKQQSIRELFGLYQSAREIETRALDELVKLAKTSRKYEQSIDRKYVKSLLGGAMESVQLLGSRLDRYCATIDNIKCSQGDVTETAFELLADFSDDQLTIDAGIYKPMYDVITEINRFAESQDCIDLEELAKHIEEHHKQFTVGE